MRVPNAVICLAPRGQRGRGLGVGSPRLSNWEHCPRELQRQPLDKEGVPLARTDQLLTSTSPNLRHSLHEGHQGCPIKSSISPSLLATVMKVRKDHTKRFEAASSRRFVGFIQACLHSHGLTLLLSNSYMRRSHPFLQIKGLLHNTEEQGYCNIAQCHPRWSLASCRSCQQ